MLLPVVFALLLITMESITALPEVRGVSAWTFTLSPLDQKTWPGGRVAFSISIGGRSDKPIRLAVPPLPRALTVTFSRNNMFAPFSSSMSVSVSRQIGCPGQYGIWVSAIESGSRKERLARVTIACALLELPSFEIALQADPGSQSIEAGQSASFKVNAKLLSGTATNISLTLADTPDTAAYTFSPASGTPPFSSILTIWTNDLTPPGNYTLLVTWENGDVTDSKSINLIIEEHKTFWEQIPGGPTASIAVALVIIVVAVLILRWQGKKREQGRTGASPSSLTPSTV